MKIVQFQDGTYGIRKFAIFNNDAFVFGYVFLCVDLYCEGKDYYTNLWFVKQHDEKNYKMTKEQVVERWSQRKLTQRKIRKMKLKKIDVGKPCRDSEFRNERIGFSFKTFLNSLAGRE